MPHPATHIVAGILVLGAVEATAYWWMHPAPAGQGEPVLVYQPGFRGQGTQVKTQEQATAQNDSSDQKSAINNHQSSISPSPASSTLTPLPEIVAAAIPSLRCSTGTAARIDRDDAVTIHVAFFEWDLTSSTNVLEAFKHLPEECMGSIGMTLVEKASVRTFVVRGQGAGVRGQETVDRGLKGQDEATAQSSSAKQQSETIIQQSSISSAPSTDSTISFDHTVFRDSRGVVIHAFKGTWVSGATNLLGEGVRGGVELWNQIRRNAAFKRFRPAHARVIQGAVRGIANPDLAWEAFEEAMLNDLSFAVLER